MVKGAWYSDGASVIVLCLICLARRGLEPKRLSH